MSPGFIAATAASAVVADAVLGEADRPLDDVRDRVGDRLQRLLRVAALRPAEMREQDHLAALVGDLGDGRRDALDAGGVGDLAVLHRHVEIDAQEHALALHVGVIEGAEVRSCQRSRVPGAAASALALRCRTGT